MGFLLDPDATLDFAVDWTDWLAAGETITAHTVTAAAGVTVASHTQNGGVVTMWLTAGVDGARTKVTSHIATSAGRQDDRSFTVQVVQR